MLTSCPLQSAFRRQHSTKTAFFSVTNDLPLAADAGFLSILILLDLSAAFNTINHSIASDRLESLISLSGLTLSLFTPYLMLLSGVGSGFSQCSPQTSASAILQDPQLKSIVCISIPVLMKLRSTTLFSLNFTQLADCVSRYIKSAYRTENTICDLHDLNVHLTFTVIKGYTGLMHVCCINSYILPLSTFL